MEEELEIILRAIDEASDTFQSVGDSVSEMSGNLENVGNAGAEASNGIDGVAESGENAGESIEGMSAAADIFTAGALMDFAQGVADSLWNLADSAGRVQDSMDRAGLEAEGFGLSAESMKGTLSDVADETGRAGGQIRESFIKATARGVTNMDSFKSMMEGAGAQAYLLGTDIQSMANKFSSMAQKDTLMSRALAETGITMQELGRAMGMTGATADEVKEKWKTLDTNQRAAILGTAASMNEGEDANDHYKHSWEGLQAQVDKAKAKLEVMVGNVLLPVLVPALELAGRVLNAFGDALNWVMSGPLGGIVSVIGALAGGIAIAVPAIAALSAAMTFFSATIWPAVAASWALIAPWLPFIALGAAVVLVIYEIGKAFGWWSDASSMIDALWAGIQRLWSAFINHPDVQAALEAIGNALTIVWNAITGAAGAIMEFFGISTGGEFDVIRALIDSIGAAWNAVREPVMAFINILSFVLGGLWQVANGNMSITQFIQQYWQTLVTNMPVILNALLQVHQAIWSAIFTLVSNLVRSLVNRVVTYFQQLPGRVRGVLMGVVSSISGAISAWISAAVSGVSSLISRITSPFSGVAGAISGALSGVVSAITAPFQAAWDAISPLVDKIRDGMKLIGAAGGDRAAGGDVPLAAGGDIGYSAGGVSVEETLNINLKVDAPGHIDTEQLGSILTDRGFIRELVNNREFQLLDSQAKERLNLKVNRSRGI